MIRLLRFIDRSDPIDRGPALFPSGMSRSGTTLLATVLDSHSQISLGYELVAPRVGSPAELEALLDEALALSDGDFRKAGGALRRSGKGEVGLLIARCQRTGISVDGLREILRAMEAQGDNKISTMRQRLSFAWRIVDAKRRREHTAFCGFKAGAGVLGRTLRYFPGGYFLCILRDPRDVVASHMERKFDRSVRQICSTWNTSLRLFRAFHRQHADRSLVLRYEDLVSAPGETLQRVFALLGLPMEEGVLAFYRSKATVHQSSHPNAANLKKAFFTSSVGRWARDLSASLAESIAKQCRRGMREYGYEEQS